MSSVELYAAGSSVVLLVGVYLVLVPRFVRQKASHAPNAPSEPRVFALGCAVFVAMLPIMAAMELWGAWGSQPTTPLGRWARGPISHAASTSQPNEQMTIKLLAEDLKTNWPAPDKWSEADLKQASREAVAIVRHFDALYKEVAKTGDAQIVRKDRVLNAISRADFVYSAKGGEDGPYRPCFLALKHFSEGYIGFFDANGSMYPQWRQWMLENCTRCEKLLK